MAFMHLLCDKCRHILKYHSRMSGNNDVDVFVGLCSECQRMMTETRKECENDKENKETDERGTQTETPGCLQ